MNSEKINLGKTDSGKINPGKTDLGKTNLENRRRNIIVSDSGFVFDPSSGQTFGLNRTGLVVVRLMQQGETLETIAKNISEQFEISLAAAEEDLREFLYLLDKTGLKIRAAEKK